MGGVRIEFMEQISVSHLGFKIGSEMNSVISLGGAHLLLGS